MRRRIYGGIILGVSAMMAFVRVQPALAANTPLDEANAIICLNTLLLQPTCFELIERIEPSVEVCKAVPTDPSTDANRFNTIGELHNRCDDADLTVTSACEKGTGPAGCCITSVEEETISTGSYGLLGKKCIKEVEECSSDRNIAYSCCICEIEGSDGLPHQLQIGESRYTYDSCSLACQTELKEQKGHIFRQAMGAYALPHAQPTAPSASELQDKLSYCFTSQECAEEEYGGGAEQFRPGMGCPKNQGRCIAPEPEVKLSFPIGGVSTVKGFRGFISTIFSYLIGVVATVAAVMFVYAGFRYIFGSAFEDIKKAKELMVNSTIGLVLVIGAVAILRTVNPMTLNLNKLEVFMINKSRILNQQFCSDISKNSDGKPLLFVDAGERPAFRPIADIKEEEYVIDQKDTQCNYEYYAQTFGSFRCKGRRCLESSQVCLPCRGNDECGEGVSKDDYICKTASWGGTIKYAGSKNVDSIDLLVACKQVLDRTRIDALDGMSKSATLILEAFHELDTAETTLTDDGKGTQTYSFRFNEDSLKEAADDCGGEANIVGFFMAFEYNDTAFGPTIDDKAIAGKQNCGSGMFMSYRDGTLGETGRGDVLRTEKEGAFCGLFGSQPMSKPESYWSLEDAKRAAGVGASPQAIRCDFELTDSNAPNDPVSSAVSKFSVADDSVTCRSNL